MMQSGQGDVIYRGTWDCVRKIVVTEGPLAFYKGNLSNMYRSIGSSLILVLQDEFKRWLVLAGLVSHAK
jgi:solute carrier family 25 (adenine nucleotide translocator) protein 4/5/6/31